MATINNYFFIGGRVLPCHGSNWTPNLGRVIAHRNAFIAIFVPKLFAMTLVYGSVVDEFTDSWNPISTSSSASFLSKKLCSRLHSIVVEFYSKKGKVRFLSHPLGSLRGNVRTPSVARWKTGHNWTFFTSSYCWDVTGRNLSTWAIFEGDGSLRSPILGGRGVAHQPLLGGRKLEGLPFHVV